jgi:hypothetical protein
MACVSYYYAVVCEGVFRPGFYVPDNAEYTVRCRGADIESGMIRGGSRVIRLLQNVGADRKEEPERTLRLVVRAMGCWGFRLSVSERLAKMCGFIAQTFLCKSG